MSAQGRATAPARAQNAQEQETPFRKFISVAQVCNSHTTLYSLSVPLTNSLPANPARLCSDTVRLDLIHHVFVPGRAHLVPASKFFLPKTSSTQPPTAIPGREPGHEQVNPLLLPPEQAHLAWPLGIPVSLHFHLSTDPSGHVFALNSEDTDLPHFVWYNITFGDWNEARTLDYNVHLPEVRML
jgi:hypothetical protein